MAEKTRNYNLTKPLESEFYDVRVQNDNMDKIDQALKEQADGQRRKADLDDSGKIPAEQLPAMDYDTKGTAAAAVSRHNEEETAHPFLARRIEACVTASQNAQIAADAALEAITKIAFTINAIPSQNGTLTYSGSVQSPSWNSFDTNALTISGVTSGTDAGTYKAIFTPKEKYQWSDNTTAPKEVEWRIERASVSVPTQTGTLTYTGSEQAPSWSSYNPAKMTSGGVVKGINAGSYNAIFTPNANHRWTDGTIGAKTVQWKINKAAGSLTLNKSSIALDAFTRTGIITATKVGDGVLSAVSSNTDVATVSASGDIITVNSVGNTDGNAVITVKVSEGTNHTAPANRTCSVSVTFPQTTLEDNSWAMVRQVSDAGQAANYWKIGDMKAITLNGTIHGISFPNVTVKAFIIGFNHNAALEGGNRIHFQIGKIGSWNGDIALCQNGQSCWQMNPSRANAGGWGSSYLRTTILGNSGTPDSPPSGSLMSYLPADLRAVMKPTTKYTDNVGGASQEAANVTTTTDYLFLLAEFEVFGSGNRANLAEQNYQAQYDYYKAGNSKRACYINADSSSVAWWTRSPNRLYGNQFTAVNTSGQNMTTYADSVQTGARPCFTI